MKTLLQFRIILLISPTPPKNNFWGVLSKCQDFVCLWRYWVKGGGQALVLSVIHTAWLLLGVVLAGLQLPVGRSLRLHPGVLGTPLLPVWPACFPGAQGSGFLMLPQGALECLAARRTCAAITPTPMPCWVQGTPRATPDTPQERTQESFCARIPE